ncbi:hypothetical protein [Dickeya dadantii]|uniref:hypothetical protein n=1 Tax=Dickeya dadantii TaxID=204038 RepID=UPI001F17618F|nr:hypothetical protein [Dickeya dadantii]
MKLRPERLNVGGITQNVGKVVAVNTVIKGWITTQVIQTERNQVIQCFMIEITESGDINDALSFRRDFFGGGDPT